MAYFIIIRIRIIIIRRRRRCKKKHYLKFPFNYDLLVIYFINVVEETVNVTYDECGCLHGACAFTEDRIRKCVCDEEYNDGKLCRVFVFFHFLIER